MRVLIVEDDIQIQHYLCELVRSEHEIVGAVENARDALAKVSNLHPDILLVDVSLPGMSGFQLVRKLHERGDVPEVIFVTNHTDNAYVDHAKILGAKGYVVKGRAQTDLLLAIQYVSQGRPYISPALLN